LGDIFLVNFYPFISDKLTLFSNQCSPFFLAKWGEGAGCIDACTAKYLASKVAVKNATECLRIHGGYGYSKEYHVERYYRDAPLMCIGEGTNAMQRIIIARQIIARHPA